jgi:hypothetical protein
MKPYRAICFMLSLNLFQLETQADLDPIVTASNVFVIADATVNVSNIQGKATIQGNGSFRAGNIGGIYDKGDLSLIAVNVKGNVSVGGVLTQKASRIDSVTYLGKTGQDFKDINRILLEDSKLFGALPSNGQIIVDNLINTITLILQLDFPLDSVSSGTIVIESGHSLVSATPYRPDPCGFNC